jgi:plasmid stabilization system protein ParE
MVRQDTIKAWKGYQETGCTQPLKKLTNGLQVGVSKLNDKHPYVTSKIHPGAIRDLQRLQEFFEDKESSCRQASSRENLKSLQILGYQPQMGRPVEIMPDEYRYWVIDFGDSGYVARYDFGGDNVVTILVVRHQKEAGFLG